MADQFWKKMLDRTSETSPYCFLKDGRTGARYQINLENLEQDFSERFGKWLELAKGDLGKMKWLGAKAMADGLITMLDLPANLDREQSSVEYLSRQFISILAAQLRDREFVVTLQPAQEEADAAPTLGN